MYQNVLPNSRLGIGHDSLESYTDAVSKCQDNDIPKEFSLVVVLSPDAKNNRDSKTSNSSNISILLGKKLRGFGKGFYNSLGGKLEKSEINHPAKGAVRELQEESGIQIELSVMEESSVGIINFTFQDSDVNRAMRVHLYCVFVSISNEKNQQSTKRFANNIVTTIRPDTIRGCDEISPEWFHDIHNIPLDNMFADDSIWLTKLLSHYNVSQDDIPPHKLQFDAWFHFQPGGTDINTIMHHYIRINNGIDTGAPEKMSLEKRLFHELHANHIHSPSIKEFKENFAFANAVRSSMKDEERMEYVLDVAGGHGGLGALFLILVPNCHTAVVIDPAQCTSGKNGVREAWSQYWNNDNKKELRYRHECLRTGLRKELDTILQKSNVKSTNITVVACHACQHLSDETLEIAAEYGVNVAVLPCCQKDHDGWWKGLTKRLVQGSNIPIGVIMDVLVAGKMMSWDTGQPAGVRYEIKMKLMKESISPQNRMILCKAIRRDGGDESNNSKIEKKKALAHERLTRAYHAAHKLPKETNSEVACTKIEWCRSSLLTGICIGSILSFFLASQIARKTR